MARHIRRVSSDVNGFAVKYPDGSIRIDTFSYLPEATGSKFIALMVGSPDYLQGGDNFKYYYDRGYKIVRVIKNGDRVWPRV